MSDLKKKLFLITKKNSAFKMFKVYIIVETNVFFYLQLLEKHLLKTCKARIIKKFTLKTFIIMVNMKD